MRPSRRQLAQLAAQVEDLKAHNARLEGEVRTHARESEDLATSLVRANDELGRARETVAHHLAAAGHPSTVLHDARAFADALEQALRDAGVDLRLELMRMNGAQL